MCVAPVAEVQEKRTHNTQQQYTGPAPDPAYVQFSANCRYGSVGLARQCPEQEVGLGRRPGPHRRSSQRTPTAHTPHLPNLHAHSYTTHTRSHSDSRRTTKLFPTQPTRRNARSRVPLRCSYTTCKTTGGKSPCGIHITTCKTTGGKSPCGIHIRPREVNPPVASHQSTSEGGHDVNIMLTRRQRCS